MAHSLPEKIKRFRDSTSIHVQFYVYVRAFWMSSWIRTELVFVTFVWLDIFCSQSNERDINPVVSWLLNQNSLYDLLKLSSFDLQILKVLVKASPII